MILGFALLFITTAQATVFPENGPSGAHFAKGEVEPICSIVAESPEEGALVSCTGTAIEGVGHTDAVLTLTVDITMDGVCHNPGNDNIVEPHSDSVTESPSTPLSASKNGRIRVPAQTEVGLTAKEIGAAFTCPNKNWREEIISLDLTYTYTLIFEGFTAPYIVIEGS